MSDVTEKILSCECLTAIELTDQDLAEVSGGQFFGGFPCFFPFFGNSFAISSIAFAGGFGGFW
jgi:bacteriocin-like protein